MENGVISVNFNLLEIGVSNEYGIENIKRQKLWVMEKSATLMVEKLFCKKNDEGKFYASSDNGSVECFVALGGAW